MFEELLRVKVPKGFGTERFDPNVAKLLDWAGWRAGAANLVWVLGMHAS